MEKEKLCLRCMRKIGNNTVCPYCRNESGKPQNDPYLPLKTVIGGRYLIGKLISSNAEGNTYNAFDLEAKKPVSIRELYPKTLLSRGEGNYCLVNVGKASEFIDTKDAFLKLWKKLSTLRGFTALTPATHIFEDLGTVYAVSEFLGEGKTLREYLLSKEQGYISWDEARVLFMPVISALGELHSEGILHGGISPTTLIIDANGKVRITGYCINDIRTEKGTLESELFDGYAAVEQYGLSGNIGTYTDIYAFAAVLYRTLIGSTPISASSRLTNDKLMIPGKFAEQLPAYVINALVNALQILPQDRTVNVDQLRDELSASPAAAGVASEAYSSMYDSKDEDVYNPAVPSPAAPLQDVDNYNPEVPQEHNHKKGAIIAFVVSAAVCLAILIGLLVGFKGCSNNGKDDETSTTDISEQTEQTEEQTEVGFVSVNVPNFVGKFYDDIKADDEYKNVLIFETKYVDSKKERGKVIKQSINPGVEVNSLSPRKIVLEVSDGIEVPDVEGLSLDEAIETLKEAGFTKIDTQMNSVATSESESNKVKQVVYVDDETADWKEIPSDGRLSATDEIVLYYYGEYETKPVITTTETQSETEEITEDSGDETTSDSIDENVG